MGALARAHLLEPLTNDALGHVLPPISFIIAGFMKCGTTSIAMALDSHPDCCHSIPKETHFFTHNYGRGFDWFRGTMAGYAGEPVIGESSMSYTLTPWTADAGERIYDHNPEIKLIFALRDPVERLVSGWKMARSRSGSSAHAAALRGFEHYVLRTEPRHPESAAWLEPLIEFGPAVDPSRTRVELNLSLYRRQIALYQQRFSSENIAFICLERWQANPQLEARRLCEFLELDPDRLPPIDTAGSNRADQRRTRNELANRLSNWRLTGALRRAMPDSISARLASSEILTTPEKHPDPQLDSAFGRSLRAFLQTESEPLLAELGMPSDLWSYGAV